MKKSVVEKAKIIGVLIPEQYDITAGRSRELIEACGNDMYDLVMNAFYFGFYKAMECISKGR